MIRSATFAAFLFLIVWAVTTPVPPPSASLYHHDSGPADRGYHEVFRVLQASPGIHHDSLRVLVDEMAQDATWTGGPWLQAGDTFAFELVSYDQMRRMQLWSDDTLLAELTFGGGAGTPVEA